MSKQLSKDTKNIYVYETKNIHLYFLLLGGGGFYSKAFVLGGASIQGAFVRGLMSRGLLSYTCYCYISEWSPVF